MSHLDEKFDRFTEITLKTAAKHRDDMETQVTTYKNKRVSEMENEFLDRAYKQIQRGVASVQKEAARQVSREMTAGKKEVLEYREALINELFDELRGKIAEFRKSDAYPEHLIQTVADGVKMVGEGTLRVEIDTEDTAHLSALSDAFSHEIVTIDGLEGGAVVTNLDTKRVYVGSIRARLAELRDEFLEMSGFTID